MWGNKSEQVGQLQKYPKIHTQIVGNVGTIARVASWLGLGVSLLSISGWLAASLGVPWWPGSAISGLLRVICEVIVGGSVCAFLWHRVHVGHLDLATGASWLWAFGCCHVVLRVSWVCKVANGVPWTEIGCCWVDSPRWKSCHLVPVGSLPSTNGYELPETYTLQRPVPANRHPFPTHPDVVARCRQWLCCWRSLWWCW